jgi:hypothetical protein
VAGENRLVRNADALDAALARGLEAAGAATKDERSRHEEAATYFSQYVELLREAAGDAAPPAELASPYLVKLELPDGRWDIDEIRLTAPPKDGDVLRRAGGDRWRVLGRTLVSPRPGRKQPRAVFRCAAAPL